MHSEGIKHRVLQLLQEQKKYGYLTEALSIDRAYCEVLSIDETANKPTSFLLQKGNGMMQDGLQEPDLAFDPYLEKIVQAMVDGYKREHPSHRFDDRKFRLSDFSWTSTPLKNELSLSLGPIAYQQFQTDLLRQKDEALLLIEKALIDKQDPHFHSSKILGITAIPFAKEGGVFIGERVDSIDYPGALSFVSGSVDFCPDLGQLDIYAELVRELKEELGCGAELQQIRFIGIAGNPYTGEMDLMFTVQTHLVKDHIHSNIFPEHRKFLYWEKEQVKACANRYKTASNNPKGKELMYSTLFGINYLDRVLWKE